MHALKVGYEEMIKIKVREGHDQWKSFRDTGIATFDKKKAEASSGSTLPAGCTPISFWVVAKGGKNNKTMCSVGGGNVIVEIFNYDCTWEHDERYWSNGMPSSKDRTGSVKTSVAGYNYSQAEKQRAAIDFDNEEEPFMCMLTNIQSSHGTAVKKGQKPLGETSVLMAWANHGGSI